MWVGFVWFVRLWVAALCIAAAAHAEGTRISGQFEAPTPGKASAITYDKSLPPLGYVDFCARGEMECQFMGGTRTPAPMTTDLWKALQDTNKTVNHDIIPATDVSLYGVADYWTYPVDKGDCEDYVLLKKRYLTEIGFKPEDLLITVVLDEHREGHAVLTVVTDKGDFILDNRRNEVLLWNETGYVFLKRQSQEAARQWVSLQQSASQVMVSTRSRSFFKDFMKVGKPAHKQ